jgi:hypothetical protein
MAEGAILDLQPSWTTAPSVLSPHQAAEGSTQVALQFTGDPSLGARLCAIDLDPEDDDDLWIIGVAVSAPWTLRPHSDIVEQQEEHSMLVPTELPTPELVEEPQDAVLDYFDCVLIKEQNFFDASDDAWFLNHDADNVMDMFYDAHNDTMSFMIHGRIHLISAWR